ncbi:hypothetical protein [Hazenella coriacea]|uniref:Uncharacterized protein n=1 Tax=Hazenella coriacea TaxID=1179467 RepID=A0A4R3LH27_9BACL|nr:hypothetical protein [Hazenella coriacea]TCS96816.1 hypothetical protein EDD58_101458 [Hazenella coriacea]
MIEQSRANLKERVIEKRMILYPEVEQIIEDIGILYPDFLHTDDWNDTVSHLDQLYQENKYYLSRSLRVYVSKILVFVKANHDEELSSEKVKEAEEKLSAKQKLRTETYL